MAESPEGTYGARFLRELRAQLQSTASLNYAAIEALENADREESGRILRRNLHNLSYAVNQMLEQAEPEVAGKWFAEYLRGQDGSAAAGFFLISSM